MKKYVKCEPIEVPMTDENGHKVIGYSYVPIDTSKTGLRGKISAWAEDHPVAAKVIKVGGLAALTGGASLLGWWARGRDDKTVPLIESTPTGTTTTSSEVIVYSEGEA